MKETECNLTEKEILELRKKYKTYDTAERLRNLKDPNYFMEKGLTYEEACDYIAYCEKIDEDIEEEKKEKAQQRKENAIKRKESKSTSENNLKIAVDLIKEHFPDAEFCSLDLSKVSGGQFTGRQTPHQLKALEKNGVVECVYKKLNKKYYRLK